MSASTPIKPSLPPRQNSVQIGRTRESLDRNQTSGSADSIPNFYKQTISSTNNQPSKPAVPPVPKPHTLPRPKEKSSLSETSEIPPQPEPVQETYSTLPTSFTLRGVNEDDSPHNSKCSSDERLPSPASSKGTIPSPAVVTQYEFIPVIKKTIRVYVQLEREGKEELIMISCDEDKTFLGLLHDVNTTLLTSKKHDFNRSYVGFTINNAVVSLNDKVINLYNTGEILKPIEDDKSKPKPTKFRQGVQSMSLKNMNISLESKSENQKLIDAARANNVEKVQRALDDGADINCRDALTGLVPLMHAVLKGSTAAAAELIRQGADLYPSMKDDWTLLHFACKYGYSDLVELFLHCGVPINPVIGGKDTKHKGMAPLHIAIKSFSVKIVEFLLKNGADPNVVSYKGTPMDLIAHLSQKKPKNRDVLNNMMAMLVEKGGVCLQDLKQQQSLAAKPLPKAPGRPTDAASPPTPRAAPPPKPSNNPLPKVPVKQSTSDGQLPTIPDDRSKQTTKKLPPPPPQALKEEQHKMKPLPVPTRRTTVSMVEDETHYQPITSKLEHSTENAATETQSTATQPTTVQKDTLRSKGLTGVVSRSYEIQYSDLKMEKEIGSGAYGVVYKAKWRSTPVAVKQLKSTQFSDKELEDFRSECDLMMKLRPHVNVVLLLGICSEKPPYCLVTEFLPNKALSQFLASDQPISQQTMFNIAAGIARGMLHLHYENIIHRDLAARNVLLTSDLQPKISDFGLSRVLSDESSEQTTTSNVGPLCWMSPEAIKDHMYSVKSDVWSYGVVLVEIYTRKGPYPGMKPLSVATRVATGELVPPIPPNTPAVIQSVMTKCWQFKPEDRPDFEQIVDILDSSQ